MLLLQIREGVNEFLEDGNLLRVRIQWERVRQMFQATIHQYDEVVRHHNVQMRGEIATLREQVVLDDMTRNVIDGKGFVPGDGLACLSMAASLHSLCIILHTTLILKCSSCRFDSWNSRINSCP